MSEPKLDGIEQGETVLEDNYPVYPGYLYVADGKVITSEFQGTVGRLKAVHKATEIRRCNIAARNLWE